MSSYSFSIKLKVSASEKTQRSFVEAGSTLANTYRKGDQKRTTPIAEVEIESSVPSRIKIEVYDSNDIPICKSIARIVMERYRIGDKYEILNDPESDLT